MIIDLCRESAKYNNIGSGRGEKTIKNVMLIYSEMRLLTSLYNTIFRKIFYPTFTLTCGASVVGCIFVLVKTHKTVNIGVLGFTFCCGVALLGALYLVTLFTSFISSNSSELKTAILSTVRRKKERKIMMHYREYGVEVGNFYIVQRITPLTLIGILANIMATMLLSVNTA
ncbi:unnamed protein product [Orchesella dallaii]|uniref:Uncharacterized protein n=1 Tax=Orchesella dallaii TaxID=48710 RepID=A0ABP1QUX9_9HEXA